MQQRIEYLLRMVSNAHLCAAGSMRPAPEDCDSAHSGLRDGAAADRHHTYGEPTGLASAPPKLPERWPNACRPGPAWRVAGRKAFVQRFVDDLVRRFLACFLLTARSAALHALDARRFALGWGPVCHAITNETGPPSGPAGPIAAVPCRCAPSPARPSVGARPLSPAR